MSGGGDQSPKGAGRPLPEARPLGEETLQAIASSTGYPRPNGVTQRIPRGGRGVSAAAETSWGSGGSMPETVALRLSILETNLSRLSETVGRLVPLLEENLQKEPTRYGAEREPSKDEAWSQRGQRASMQSPAVAGGDGDEEYWQELEFRDRMAREVERQQALGTLRPPTPTGLPTPRMGVGVERPLGPGIGSSGLAEEGEEEPEIHGEEEDVPYDEGRRSAGATVRPAFGWVEGPTAAAEFREPRGTTAGMGRGVFKGAVQGNPMQPFPRPPIQQQRATEWMPRREELKLEYGGESSELNFFLIGIRGYMEDNAHTFPSEGSMVRAIGNTLKRGAASWYVQLHARRDPCLRSVPRFLAALENRFRDPLEQLRARDQLKGIKQRDKTVPEYAEEFLHLAERVPEWSEVTKVEIFKEGLRPEIFSWVAHRDDPETLKGWIQLAGRVESTLSQVKRFRSGGGGGQQRPVARGRGETRKQERPGGRPGIPFKGDDNRPKPGCFVCGKTGHRAAECWARKGEPPKASKPTPAAGRRAEEEVRAPESPERLVSQDKRMLVVPICLSGLENRATCRAFLDCGCSRNIITPELAGALKCRQTLLDSPIAFSQLDGSVAAGEVSTKEIQGIPCKIGKWEGRISFVIAPIATYNIILGIPWLEQANPEVDWRGKSMAFKEQQTQWEISKIAEEENEGDEAGEIDQQLLPPEYRDFVDVFNQKEASKLPPKRNIEVEIEITPGANLPKPKVYPMSVQEKEELRKYIDKNLARGFIKPSNSPLGAPVLFRRKKDNSLRLCIDYRNLNAITKDNKYPMPLVKDLITVLKKGSMFTKLDLIEAYHKLRIKPEDTWKTAFSCAFGHFEYQILPFGLKNGSACFMQLINEILHPLLYRGVFIFLDDILIVSEDKEKHVELVREVLQRLREAKLYAKLSKCEFNKTQIDFLGYRISPDGLAMDPSKVSDVKEWGVPQTRRQLQSFLGFANFYRSFIKGFAQITAPLTELLKTKGKGEQKGGIWFVKKKLYIPAILRIKILHRFHNNQSAGHMGITKTIKAIAKQCWWPGMRKDIKNHVIQCDDCARNKSRGGKPMGLLQTVAEPTRPWECVAMDFVGELPVSKGHRYIWTILDLFSKQAHFIALTKLPSAEKLAELYINHIYKLHGCPSRVVSDRGVQFTAKFWEKFLEMLGAERSLSSAFHPMTNGAVERTQQTLGQFLRMYSNMRQNDWSKWLAFAELAFNSTIHSATNKTPFEVVYGYEIQPLPQLPRWTENEEIGAGKWKTQMLECWSQVTASLKEAHKKYKTFADRKRMEGDKLEKGDLVWLSTQNIKLGLPSRKLGPKYIGPFRIQGVINEVTFQLALPKSLGKIHPVFHRSLLKKYMGTLDKMDT
uniref:ribonuclease H n=1 Tax=Anolis carolinensis TaxID=28377 RepID=A0A803TMJ7_ANOCA